MTNQPNTPFETIESAQEYLRLLLEELNRVLADVEANRKFTSASASVTGRYLDALCLVHYKLQKLQQHIQVSGRILNDLRLLRRLFDRNYTEVRQVNRDVGAKEQEHEHLGV